MPKSNSPYGQTSNNSSRLSSRGNFLLGISWGIAIVSLTGFFILLAVFVSGRVPADSNVNNVNAKAVNPNPNPNPNVPPPEPEADLSKLSPVTDVDHIRGDANAQITMIEFSDFECPFCKIHKATVDKILNDYQGKVRLVFRHFPLTMLHPNAQKDAEASECASEQGKFWEMHDKIFAATPPLTVDILKSYAKDLKLDTTKFNDCLDSGKYASKVNAMAGEGQAAGVTGTPATFVNGQLIKGALPYESFKQIIDGLLQ